VTAIRPSARGIAGLVIGTIVVLALAPGAARQRPPFEGPLQAYQPEPVAFVGQLVERRGSTIVLSVRDSFKGVLPATVVEVVDHDGVLAKPLPVPADSVPAIPEYGVLAATEAAGRLHTDERRVMLAQDLGAAFRAAGKAAAALRRSGSSASGARRRAVTCRCGSSSLTESSARTRCTCIGGPATGPGLPGSLKLVPASRTLVLRHRYRKRRDHRKRTIDPDPQRSRGRRRLVAAEQRRGGRRP
jgi:hypothetical protein